MKITEKTQNLIGKIWKVLSAIAVVFLFVITISKDYGESSANDKRDYEMIKSQITILMPSMNKIKELESQVEKHSNLFDFFKETLNDKKEVLLAISASLVNQDKELVKLRENLNDSTKNIISSLTDISKRIDRLEDRVNEIR